MLLADWSIEILKSRRLKRKQEKEEKRKEENKEKDISDSEVIENEEKCTHKDKKELKKEKKEKEKQEKLEKKEKKKKGKGKGEDLETVCTSCQENHQELERQRGQLVNYQTNTNSVIDLVNQIYQDERGCPETGAESCENEILSTTEVVTEQNLTEAVQKLVLKTKDAREQLSAAKRESSDLAEGIGRQLKERDRVHSEKLRAMETLMKEKERQLLLTANTLRQQLSAAKRGLQQLEFKEEQLLTEGSQVSEESLEQEVTSLRMVLEMRRVEVEQLRVANNCLMMELERCRQLELQLQQLAQRTEEMDAVIQNKNIEIRRLYDDQERLSHQLEIEESAHLACQQELERSQWSLETFIATNRETILANVEHLKKEETGIILDLIHKDKSVAYNFNC